MAFAYHGNYCGPGWSNGQYQASVVGDKPPTDSFDATCKIHDAVYAEGGDLEAADYDFARSNISLVHPKRAFAGLLVGAQGVFRTIGLLPRVGDYQKSTTLNNIEHEQNMTKTKYAKSFEKALQNSVDSVNATELARLNKEISRLEAQLVAKNIKKPGLRNPFKPMTVSPAPVSLGTTVTASTPTTRTIKNGVNLTGREFVCAVFEADHSNWQAASIAPVHPAFYPGSTIGNVARNYQFYRFKKLIVHFVTRQPTSVTGEIVLCYAKNVLDPAIDGSLSTFIPRVMTMGNAILGPLWQNHSMIVDVDSKFRLVDCFNAGTFADNVNGEIQAYTLSGVTDTAGYLLWDYEIEFTDTMFTPHSSAIPVSTGPGTQYSLGMVATAANTAAICTNGTIAAFNNGTIFKFVIDVDQSTVGTGATISNLFLWESEYGATTTTVSSVANNFVAQDGTVLWLLVVGSNILVYTSYEAALSGDGSGQVFVRTATSTASTFVGLAYVARFSPTVLISTQ